VPVLPWRVPFCGGERGRTDILHNVLPPLDQVVDLASDGGAVPDRHDASRGVSVDGFAKPSQVADYDRARGQDGFYGSIAEGLVDTRRHDEHVRGGEARPHVRLVPVSFDDAREVQLLDPAVQLVTEPFIPPEHIADDVQPEVATLVAQQRDGFDDEVRTLAR